MISKFNKLRKEMELQLTDEIFFTNDDPIQRVNGWFYPSDYDVFHYEVKKYDYKINKNVFEEFNFEQIKIVLEDMARAWSEWPYDELYEDEDDREWCLAENERMANICLESIDTIETKYEYYLELNKLYEHILDDDTECKTLPNKTYTTKERRN